MEMEGLEKRLLMGTAWGRLVQRWLVPRLVRFAQPPPVADGLEVGAGGGFGAEKLLDRFPDWRLTVTDYDEDMVELARTRLGRFSPRARVERADAALFLMWTDRSTWWSRSWSGIISTTGRRAWPRRRGFSAREGYFYLWTCSIRSPPAFLAAFTFMQPTGSINSAPVLPPGDSAGGVSIEGQRGAWRWLRRLGVANNRPHRPDDSSPFAASHVEANRP
jgi:hypothetical protein